MTIRVKCPECQRVLEAKDRYAGKRAECPDCGKPLTIPNPGDEPPKTAEDAGRGLQGRPAGPVMDIEEYLDPPGTAKPVAEPPPPVKPVVQRMLEAMLDPRAIQWLLTIGGGLAILGLIIWLVSIGIFANSLAVALVMGVASLALLGAGWWVTLHSSHRVAGQALTFIACVVAPLNLWYYQSQGLVTIDQHLWLGGLVCLGLYVATVFKLRDPLFLYAVEAGITLTVLLLASDLNYLNDASHVAVILMVLAAASIHAERLFAPEGVFDRQRYGLAVFWSGQAQLGAALVVLLGSQAMGWLSQPLHWNWAGNPLTEDNLLAGGLWIGATYLCLYSDLVVRRIGLYSYFAGVCLLMAEVTLIMPHLSQEGLIALLSVTVVGIQMLVSAMIPRERNPRLHSHLGAIAVIMGEVAVMWGILLHVRATTELRLWDNFSYQTGWPFVACMVTVALANRLSAFLVRRDLPKLSLTHFVISAAALMVAYAGLLRQFGLTHWAYQAPWLMLMPMGYIIAARLWRGHSPEVPLARVSHMSTAVILLGTLLSARRMDADSFWHPLQADPLNLQLAITFAVATAFYTLAGVFRRRSWNGFLGTVTGCAAIWQLMGYFGVEPAWHPLILALPGLGLLLAARQVGVTTDVRYLSSGDRTSVLRGAGMTLLTCGNGVLTIALVMTVLRGIGRMIDHEVEWVNLGAMIAMTVVAFLAAVTVPPSGWRRWYHLMAIALIAIDLQAISALIKLSPWQKFEIFCVIAGVLSLIVSHIGRFREHPESHEKQDAQQEDGVTLGLWFGSFLTVVPLFVAFVYHRFVKGTPSTPDELVLLTMTVLMLATGCSWQVQSTAVFGGLGLFVYLAVIIGSIAYRPEVAVGVYLLVGGALLFGSGILLSIYRDRLLKLPDQISRREGIFKIIGWR
jgi:hypothetical protein